MAESRATDVPKMIRIDKLVEKHEPAPPAPLSVPVKTLLAHYEKIPAATVSDVLREYGLLDFTVLQAGVIALNFPRLGELAL